MFSKLHNLPVNTSTAFGRKSEANTSQNNSAQNQAGLKLNLRKKQPVSSNTINQAQRNKKIAAQRAAQLKQRLEVLKKVLPNLPPGNHKALALEMKRIAKELASLGKQLNGAGGSAMPANVSAAMTAGLAKANANFDAEMAGLEAESGTAVSEVPLVASLTVEVAPEVGAVEINNAEIAALQAEAAQMASDAENAAAQEVTAGAVSSVDEEIDEDAELKQQDKQEGLTSLNNQPAATADEDDAALRSALAEAKKIFKEVLAMLKAKHQPQDKESRELYKEIDEFMDELDKDLGLGKLVQQEGSLSLELTASVGQFLDIKI